MRHSPIDNHNELFHGEKIQKIILLLVLKNAFALVYDSVVVHSYLFIHVVAYLFIGLVHFSHRHLCRSR